MGKLSTGSVFQHKNGLWVAKASINGKRVFKYAKTQAEAEQLRHQLLTQAAPQPALPKDCFATFVDTWFDSAGLKPKTLESYRHTLNGYVLPLLGSKRITEITALDIAAVIASTKKLGLSDRTVQYAFEVTRRMLQAAYEWDLIPANPALRLKKPKAAQAEKAFWTVEQTQQFIDRQGVNPWNPLFTLSLFTGLRLGEMLGLQWADIDFNHKMLRVQRSLVELSKLQFVLQTPKSRSSLRTIA